MCAVVCASCAVCVCGASADVVLVCVGAGGRGEEEAGGGGGGGGRPGAVVGAAGDPAQGPRVHRAGLGPAIAPADAPRADPCRRPPRLPSRSSRSQGTCVCAVCVCVCVCVVCVCRESCADLCIRADIAAGSDAGSTGGGGSCATAHGLPGPLGKRHPARHVPVLECRQGAFPCVCVCVCVCVSYGTDDVYKVVHCS
jgi:hypothetical protein